MFMYTEDKIIHEDFLCVIRLSRESSALVDHAKQHHLMCPNNTSYMNLVNKNHNLEVFR